MSAFSGPENNFMHTEKQSCWSTILLPVVNCFYLFITSGVDCVSDPKIWDLIASVYKIG